MSLGKAEIHRNRTVSLLFGHKVAIRFIVGAEPAYHGGIAVEPASNLGGFHAAPDTREIRKLALAVLSTHAAAVLSQ
jgi:hypothetical protein